MTRDLKAMYRDVQKDAFPDSMTILLGEEKLVYKKRTWTLDGEEKGLRYGENPDQPAALYELVDGGIVTTKELSSIVHASPSEKPPVTSRMTLTANRTTPGTTHSVNRLPPRKLKTVASLLFPYFV